MKKNDKWNTPALHMRWVLTFMLGFSCTAEVGLLHNFTPGACPTESSPCQNEEGTHNNETHNNGTPQEGTPQEGTPHGKKEGEPCPIGEDSCEAGLVCKGDEASTLGHCQPECIVGNPEECPEGHVCMGLEPGTSGICELTPECYIGDNSCPAWQNCISTHGNQNGAPGRCQGEPECHIGNSLCAGHTPYCLGYESNAPGAPGSCHAEPECRVGSPWTCPTHTTCVGVAGAQWDEPGSCQPSPRPRRLDLLYVFFGHNSVGRDISYGLSRIQPALPETLRLSILSRMPSNPDRRAHIHQLTNNGANNFGNPNRQPALLEIHYELWQTYALAREQLDIFLQQVRNIMNGHTNNAGQHVPPQRLDIVALKFCFAPFETGTDADVDTFFNHYATHMDALQREFPELIVVHFTQATQHCIGNNLAYQQVGNRRRMQFRQRILERYERTGRVFDLTQLEATDPQGQIHACNYNDSHGNPVLGLLSSYALPNDYGHFNTTAGDLIAREFAHFLANVR
ncbi:MAG: hypothetical protein FWG75_10195 [Cystobacterineae bacterium]|nr:hypothetical protein [Cystobacterineae bacterium]